jgi:hypothetical protein
MLHLQVAYYYNKLDVIIFVGEWKKRNVMTTKLPISMCNLAFYSLGFQKQVPSSDGVIICRMIIISSQLQNQSLFSTIQFS